MTQGTHVGVAKLIGSAVKEYIVEAGTAKLDDAVLMGIVNYTSVTGHETLRVRKKQSIAKSRESQLQVRKQCG